MAERDGEPGVEQANEGGVERDAVDPSEQSPGRTSEGYGGTSRASGLDRSEVERMNEAADRSRDDREHEVDAESAAADAEGDVERG